MMFQLFKKVLKYSTNFIFKKNTNHNTNIVERFSFLKENGNLIIGKDCLIEESFNIHSNNFQKGNTNVTIGDDCHLMGTIELYNLNAQVKIGNRVFIGPNTKLFCRESITIEDDTMISWGCTLIDTNAHSLKAIERKNDVVNWKKGHEYKDWNVVSSKPIIVRSKSWIGFNTIITKGVTIEEGTVIGSGSVVTKSTKKFTVVGGNPAAFIKDTE